MNGLPGVEHVVVLTLETRSFDHSAGPSAGQVSHPEAIRQELAAGGVPAGRVVQDPGEIP